MKPFFPTVAALSALLPLGLGWWQAASPLSEKATAGSRPRSPTQSNPVLRNAGGEVLLRAHAGDEWEVWEAKLTNARTRTDLGKIAAEVAAIEVYHERTLVLGLLCARWVEVDPGDGMSWWQQEKPKGLEQMPGVMLTEWALRDVEKAWAHISSETDVKKRQQDAGVVGETLLRENPILFWKWFQKAGVPLPHSGGKPSAAWLAIGRDHQEELETVAAGLSVASKDELNSAIGPAYTGLYQLLARVRGERDAAAALQWAWTVPEEVRNACLGAVLPLLAKTDPVAAGKALDAMKNKQVASGFFIGSGRDAVVAEIAREMAQTDPTAAVEWMAKIPDDSGSADVAGIAEIVGTALKEGRLSSRDAFALIRRQQSEGEFIRMNVLRMMWEGLPAEKLAETAAWLKDVESANAKAWALGGLVSEWAKTDPKAAMAFAASQSDDASLRQQIYGNMLSPLLYNRTLPGALAGLLLNIPPADRAAVISDQVRMRYGDGMLEHGGFGTQTFQGPAFGDALVQVPAGEARDGAAKRVFTAWGALDPDGALGWTARQEDPGLRHSALMATIEGWAKFDAWAASQWLAEQPRGLDRDAASHQLARSLREVEPDSAWTWASDISDEAVRLEARAAVLRKWRESDVEGARAAVSSLTGLTPAGEQKLLEVLAGKDR